MFEYLAKKEKGFTLMELLIAVAIVAVLAGVGIPLYMGLQGSAKATEATANLDGIGTSQEAYKLTNGTYITCGVSPRIAVTKDPVPWADLDGAAGGFTAIGFDTNKAVRFAYAVKAGTGAAPTDAHLNYYAGALGDTDGDAVAAPRSGYVLYIAAESFGPRIVTGADDAHVTELNDANAFGAGAVADTDTAD